MSTIFDFFRRIARDGYNTIRSWPLHKKILVVAAITLFIVLTTVLDVPNLETLQHWAHIQGSWFLVTFFLLYVLITQFPIPRTLLTLSSGVLFGPVVGIAIAISATTCSAALSLVIVRGLIGDWMRPKLSHPATRKTAERLYQRGWVSIFFLRMIAGIPFSVLNYVAAMTPVPLFGFTVATLFGSAPGTMAVVLLGDSLVQGANTKIFLFALVLAILGVLGLIIDARIPVKAQK